MANSNSVSYPRHQPYWELPSPHDHTNTTIPPHDINSSARPTLLVILSYECDKHNTSPCRLVEDFPSAPMAQRDTYPTPNQWALLAPSQRYGIAVAWSNARSEESPGDVLAATRLSSLQIQLWLSSKIWSGLLPSSKEFKKVKCTTYASVTLVGSWDDSGFPYCVPVIWNAYSWCGEVYKSYHGQCQDQGKIYKSYHCHF